ncbi:MAG TPA: metallophosphoesterase family protein [Phycisphaerae bacterium]|nr:metallophosphoesterase family protein [Phycisphaerae bacterium]HRR83818.1 metallophosphoesterase family protein [Phycisphaerae bacterium]
MMYQAGITTLRKIIVRAAFIGLFVSSLPAVAQAPSSAQEAPPRMPAAVQHAPSVMPDRIVLTWTGDTTTTQAVTWRTSTEVSLAYCEVAEAEAGPQFPQRARRVNAVTRVFRCDLSKCHMHRVEMTDLKPATRYVYRVGDGENWSEWFQFRTASAAPERFSFIYLGDGQNDLHSMWSRVVRQAYSDAPRAAFTLHAGDLVTSAESDALWGEWFAAGAWINATVPVIATPGNHDYASTKNQDGTSRRWLSRHWAVQFAFPANGPEGLAESVYYIDYQNCRIISLNSNEKQEEQVGWMDKVLSENKKTWTVITFHHPIFSTAKGRDSTPLRELWKPVFDRHGVDLVLTGHDHTYGRSGLVAPETNVTTGSGERSISGGTVYVVSVSGPKMYDLSPASRAEVRRSAEDTQLYQIVSIDGPVLRYEARTATGDLYDAFTLKKRAGQLNEMIEQVPNVPERRRPAETAKQRRRNGAG